MKRSFDRAKAWVSLFLLLPLVGCASWAHDRVLTEKLPPILHKLDDSGARISARVIELPSGRELYSDHADTALMPASNLKLVVSAAALDTFGPDHVFTTYLAVSGEDVWIVGAGDPGIGDSPIAKSSGRSTTTVLEEWAGALTAAGCTHVRDIRYDESYFEAQRIHPHWDEEDLIHWYACPVSGLNFNDNCIDVVITPGPEGTPVQYTVTPPNTVTTILNQCVSHATEHRVSIAKEADRQTYVISGLASKTDKLKSKPVDEPGAFFADALRTVLQDRGVAVTGAIQPIETCRGADGAPLDCRIVAVHETKMTDVLWRTNKSSQNLFAECLDKGLGRAWAVQDGRDEGGSWAAGSEAIHAFLRRHGIDSSRLVVDDGSGLSRANRVTARLLTDLLRVMFTHPYAKAYRDSLAQVGVDGTIAGRLADLKGHVFAKTGYIGGVRCLSGYIKTDDSRWLAFSFLYNDIPGPVKPFEALQDDACRVLANRKLVRTNGE